MGGHSRIKRMLSDTRALAGLAARVVVQRGCDRIADQAAAGAGQFRSRELLKARGIARYPYKRIQGAHLDAWLLREPLDHRQQVRVPA